MNRGDVVEVDWPYSDISGTKFADANGDGIITRSEVTVGGTPQWAGTPRPTQGAVLTSSWRVGARWHASLTLDYRAGQTLFNSIAWWR